ncbi:hypothetical protein Cni_G18100 [Canna indica]|uniref:Stigma-specific Stig1 family protein n=1 Tax=Canna indica TaxID=4628 RepID=A0AAQ3KNS6_9LILI|nr:hypothetical protein Cni_G18100 [Canna indica]
MAMAGALLFVMALAAVALAFSLALPSTYDYEEEQYPIAASFFPRRAKHMACNKFPRICHAKGSPGPDCCRKRCVNVKTDGLNCGRCGRRCRFGWACCVGKCVNVTCDESNCGGCKRKCKKGSFCRYGMCSYA